MEKRGDYASFLTISADGLKFYYGSYEITKTLFNKGFDNCMYIHNTHEDMMKEVESERNTVYETSSRTIELINLDTGESETVTNPPLYELI